MITLENYESYLFLYQEGELDSSTRTEVERFLLQHPDIREEMEQYYDPTLVVTAEPPVRQSRRVSPLWRWAAAACVVQPEMAVLKLVRAVSTAAVVVAASIAASAVVFAFVTVCWSAAM